MTRTIYYDEDDYPIPEQYREEKIEPEYGCGFCWDKRSQKEKELYFFDAANNLRVCHFCPNCGRAYNEVYN